MTYTEAYRKAESFKELKKMVFNDYRVAVFLGNNQDRIKAIEDAMNNVIEEKGWDEVTE